MKHTRTLPTALLLAPLAAIYAAADLALSTNGRTEFRIVKPANPSAVDEYAVARLSGYLKQITGAEFPVVESLLGTQSFSTVVVTVVDMP
ncbi:MAG: hypothetical protein A2283_14065 [Lentisphaerae bacterium RIFOXYA12_FULL_48_11]|nr:MAG: hypothetical protein A2283_14065 [Lentisphaerae bacterium RIFOXYA12_FULL_48_11]